MVTLHANDARDHLARRIAELHAGLRPRDAVALARRTGARLEAGCLTLPVWGTAVSCTPPDFTPRAAGGAAVDLMTQALLAYYFTQSDGTLLTGSWIAFTELPDGQFYTAAFQGYTGQQLARAFGNDLQAFAAAAVAAGGHSRPFADRAFVFDVLPRVRVLAAAWQGDDDFPPSYRVLFDANTPRHLPTDACAIVGSTLARRLTAAHPGNAGGMPA